MSYIPNCRPKLEKDAGPFPHKSVSEVKEGEINPYWYGLLQGEDKSLLQGFDWCLAYAVNNLFDNLDIYAEELEEIGISVDDIDMNVVNGANSEINVTLNNTGDDRPCKYYFEYTDEELDKMNSATKLMLQLKTIINHYVEMERNELVTGMIEDMDNSKHEKAIKMAEVNNLFDAASKGEC